MCAISKHHEMKNYSKYLAAAGFEVRTLQDGTLEVKDPYHLNGKANAGYDLVTLRTPRAVEKFIADRS